MPEGSGQHEGVVTAGDIVDQGEGPEQCRHQGGVGEGRLEATGRGEQVEVDWLETGEVTLEILLEAADEADVLLRVRRGAEPAAIEREKAVVRGGGEGLHLVWRLALQMGPVLDEGRWGGHQSHE